MATEDSVKVAVRVRPFNQREISAKSECIISMRGNVTTIVHPETKEMRTFAFDHSYWSHDGFKENANGLHAPSGKSSCENQYADQMTVFNDLGQGVLENAWRGYHTALFAYGQTGSGKSYSMVGYGPNKGIVPIVCEQLFDEIHKNDNSARQFQVTFSMLEIYNENVRDLLTPTNKQFKGGLRIRLHPTSGFYVEGLKHVPVSSYDEIDQHMQQGTLNRTTASTRMNATSSRSHMVIKITFKQLIKTDGGRSNTRVSEMNLVDLAGSERARSTGASGDRLKEGCLINLSLTCLGKVISALADQAAGKKRVVIPYRDSVLTRLLQSALGGNSKTLMVAALSPAAINHDETLSTLRYADRAKRIQNKAVVNENPTDKLIRELKSENAKLLAELQKMQTHGIQSTDVQDMLDENERQVALMAQNWEARLDEARREWLRTKDEEVAHQANSCPHFTNVNEDPQLSGVVKTCFQFGRNTLGSETDKPEMRIRGLGIESEHVYVDVDEDQTVITPVTSSCYIIINGSTIKGATVLQHMDRVKLGCNNLYLYIGHPSERSPQDNYSQYDYGFFQTELAGPMSQSLMVQSLPDTEIDEAALAVFQDYVNLLPLVNEVNAMSIDMEKKVRFTAEIKNLASNDSLGKPSPKEIIVKVHNTKTNKIWSWSYDKFMNRKFLIEDLYECWLDGEQVDLDHKSDPFWDPLDEVFLGSAHVWLQNISYCMDSEDQMDIRDYRGKEIANVSVSISPCDKDGQDEMIVFDPKELIGTRIDFIVMVSKLADINWIKEDSSRGVFCGFTFYDHPELIRCQTVWNKTTAALNFQKHFTIMKVTKPFLEYAASHALVLELWGCQVPDESKPASATSRVQLADMTQKTDDMKELQRQLKVKDDEIAVLRRECKLNRAKISNSVIRKHPSLPPSSPQRSPQGTRKLLKPHPPPTQPQKLKKHPKFVMDRVLSPLPDIVPPMSNTSFDKTKARKTAVKRKEAGPVASSPSATVMDAELAKSLKVFFRDVKGVQRSLAEISSNGELTENTRNSFEIVESYQTQQTAIQEVDAELSRCVLKLRETMLVIMRRKRQLSESGMKD